jgi:hypothetical protein
MIMAFTTGITCAHYVPARSAGAKLAQNKNRATQKVARFLFFGCRR